MQTGLMAVATAGAPLISARVSAAIVGYVTQPGETVGIAAGVFYPALLGQLAWDLGPETKPS